MMKRVLFVALVLLIAASLFTGCGKNAKTAGVEFILNNQTEPQSLDPTQIQGVPEDRLWTALFEGLVASNPETNKAIPGVAEKWERNADGSVITFYLRKNAKWSDGTPINAKTFVDSWLYYLSPETAAVYAYMPASVIKGATEYNAGNGPASGVGIRAVDDYTFEVTLIGPVPYAVDMMTHYSFGPLPLHVMKKLGSEWTKPGNFVGNGPFTLESWTPQEKITAVPNETYWNKKNVHLSRVTFLAIENDTTAYNKYKNGEIDWIPSIPVSLIDEISLDPNFHSAPFLTSYYYILNVNNPVLKDVRVRQALCYSIDRIELVEKVLKGGQIPSGAFVPEMAGYTPAEGFTLDIAKARSLLSDAGYPDGKGFPKFTVIYNTSENHKKIAEWVQQQWKNNLNIDIELQNMEWGSFLDKRQSNDFDISRSGWNSDYQDPSNFLDLLRKDSGNNDGRYSNPAYDALLDKAAQMQDGAERNKILREAEMLGVKQDAAVIPFYIYTTQNMIDLNKWEGWYPNAADKHPLVGFKLKDK